MSNSPEENSQNTTFLPLVMMGAALVLGLGSQLSSISRERIQVQREKEVQEQQLDQLKEVKPRLERIALGLLELSKTNPNARAIVAKHGITAGPPGQPAAAPQQPPQ